MSTPTLRPAARVITLDEHDRVLLLRYEDEAGGGFWATPGGSLEPGEDYARAAAREVREELGVDDVVLGPQVAIRSSDHLVGGRPVRQVERYYIARIPAAQVRSQDATQPDEIQGWCWWSLPELSASDQSVYPIGLGDLVAAYLTHGAPLRPLQLAG
ncbi:hypothetical protein GCM10010156_72910 [Planobispora rosea]|uniref:Nudix hydrolase domain-containing protein n=1 Tax=Planobispora rosea TaxID=35762 RepID=A0A8J3S6M1_PLARO|nr:NUDIX domain-containing protein [Planobispora rosea]GGT04534.1 hypothetical protein GCM10010156_72910 [Planobispora rosea]GIH88897.1 hypothetical protein Pro02_73050 [Planobispora rosea]